MENHSCCNAFTHMMAARVSVIANRKTPPAANFRILRVHSTDPVSSCFSDHLLSPFEIHHHIRKQNAATI